MKGFYGRGNGIKIRIYLNIEKIENKPRIIFSPGLEWVGDVRTYM